MGLVQALTRPALLDEVLEKGTEVGASFFVLVPAAESTRLPESARARSLGALASDRGGGRQAEQASGGAHGGAGDLGRGRPRGPERARRALVAAGALGAGLASGEAGTDARGAQPRRSRASIALWIGPEERLVGRRTEQFAAAGVEAVRLGQGVLRAETAGPVAVAVTRLAMGDW